MRRSIKKAGIFTILILAVNAASAFAAPYSMSFWNEFQADAVYLYINQGGITFNSASLGGAASGWTINSPLNTDRLVLSGSMINPSTGLFGIVFSNRKAFTMQWAEMLNGAIQESGTLTFNNGGNITSATYGTGASAVPIPESIWLLGSALICFVGIRRKALIS